ncbi:MAG: FAD-binding oxidoreductase [Planctomycetota bacterium]|nr:FAD-binding oxidoreductase [Planctomycetota bacterium]
MKPKRGFVHEVLGGLGIACAEDTVPTALPKDAEQAARVMGEAGRRGWKLLPVGLGHQLAHVRPESQGFDLWLSTRRMQQVVLYEPGEATITLQPGVIWQYVQGLAAENNQCLSPTFHADIPRTVGGVIAAGFSGLDRPLRGALRHQVLGMRVLMADGTIAVTGGRLVKNVAGFDLHRLHTGGRGQLGVIMEASLRLHNEPQETVVLGHAFESVGVGVAAARRLHSARLPGSGLLLQIEESGACRLACSLQGSPGLIADANRLAALAMDFEWDLRGAPAQEYQTIAAGGFDLDPQAPWLFITCQPTAIEAVQASAWTWLELHSLHASGILQPDVAQWYLRIDGEVSAPALSELEKQMAELGAVLTPLGSLRPAQWNPAAQSTAPLRQAVEALRQQFDPEDRFQARLA